MLRVTLILLLAAALSGCVGADVDGEHSALLEKQLLSGQVVTPNFNPIAGAQVTVQTPASMFDDGTSDGGMQEATATTDANGSFELLVFPGNHPFHVHHDDYRDLETTVVVPQANLSVQLVPTSLDIPYFDSLDFEGRIECAVEAFIITPSCDTLAKEEVEDAAVFQDDSVFTVHLDQGWQSIVLDVHYDPARFPGVAGIRVSAYSGDSNAEVFDYERITQKSASGSFSMRVDAGADYGDDIPAPSSSGGVLRFEFFPHGHGDDAVCVPADSGLPEQGRCFLGVAAAQNFEFTATATMFVHEAAPTGWTTLDPN